MNFPSYPSKARPLKFRPLITEVVPVARSGIEFLTKRGRVRTTVSKNIIWTPPTHRKYSSYTTCGSALQLPSARRRVDRATSNSANPSQRAVVLVASASHLNTLCFRYLFKRTQVQIQWFISLVLFIYKVMCIWLVIQWWYRRSGNWFWLCISVRLIWFCMSPRAVMRTLPT